jgi:hypothetical protein
VKWLDLSDLLVLLGLVLLGIGLWWVWPPLGLIVPGAVLLIVGLVTAMWRRPGGPPPGGPPRKARGPGGP